MTELVRSYSEIVSLLKLSQSLKSKLTDPHDIDQMTISINMLKWVLKHDDYE